MPIDLKKVTKGVIAHACRVALYSADGIGKTRFAAGAPDPLFLDVNKGSLAYDVRRVMPENWIENMEWLAAVEKGQVQCETLVQDSVTDLEMMLHTHLFQGTTIDEYKGGFKRGDTLAFTHWLEWKQMIERIWLKGINVILIGHMSVRHFEDPSGPGYDRFELGIRAQPAGLIRQWCSYVLFAREDVHMQTVGKGLNEKQKATTTNVRTIYTRRTPAYDAKSRGTTMFPEKLALSWDDFDRAVKADAVRIVELRKEIDELLAELGDPAATKAMNDWIGGKPERLVEARNRVAAKLAEKRDKNPPTAQPQQQSQPATTQPAAATSV